MTMTMTKEEKIKKLIEKTEEETDKVFWTDIRGKHNVLRVFFELVKDVIEETEGEIING